MKKRKSRSKYKRILALFGVLGILFGQVLWQAGWPALAATTQFAQQIEIYYNGNHSAAISWHGRPWYEPDLRVKNSGDGPDGKGAVFYCLDPSLPIKNRQVVGSDWETALENRPDALRAILYLLAEGAPNKVFAESMEASILWTRLLIWVWLTEHGMPNVDTKLRYTKAWLYSLEGQGSEAARKLYEAAEGFAQGTEELPKGQVELEAVEASWRLEGQQYKRQYRFQGDVEKVLLPAAEGLFLNGRALATLAEDERLVQVGEVWELAWETQQAHEDRHLTCQAVAESYHPAVYGWYSGQSVAQDGVLGQGQPATVASLDIELSKPQQVFSFALRKVNIQAAKAQPSLAGTHYELHLLERQFPALQGQAEQTLFGPFVCDETGQLTFEHLPLGRYTLHEKKAAQGYVLNPVPVKISGLLGSDGQVHVSIDNQANYAACMSKLEQQRESLAKDLAALSQPTQQLSLKKAGLSVGALAQRIDLATYENLAMGRVRIHKFYREKPEKRQPDGPSPELGAEMPPEEERLQPEEGVRFELRDLSGKVWDVLETNAAGQAASAYVPIGHYELHQVSDFLDARGEKATWRLPPQAVHIAEDGQVLDLLLENPRRQMRFRLHKVDRLTGKPIHQKGMAFYLFRKGEEQPLRLRLADGRPLDRLVLGEDGQSLPIEPLPAGDYELQEVQGPEGYHYDPKARLAFRLAPTSQDGEEVVEVAWHEEYVANDPQFGSLFIDKQGEQFSHWEAYEASVHMPSPGRLVPRKMPRSLSKNLLLCGWPQQSEDAILQSFLSDELTLKTKGEEGSEKPELTSSSEPKEVEAAQGVEAKEKAASQKPEPLAPAGESLVQKRWRISQQAPVMQALELGEERRVRAQLEPGYYMLWDQEACLWHGEVDEEAAAHWSLQLPEKVDTWEAYEAGPIQEQTMTLYRPIYQNKALPGAVFKLTAARDIYAGDQQTLIYPKGERLQVAVKDIWRDGERLYRPGEAISLPELTEAERAACTADLCSTSEGLTIQRLPLGDYDLQEVQAPPGYIKDEQVYRYTFSPQKAEIRVVTPKTPPIVNLRQVLNLTLASKTLESYPWPMHNAPKVEQVAFGLYNSEPQGGLPADTCLQVLHPNAEGRIQAENLPQGAYYLKEIAAPDGYQIDSKRYPVQLEADPVAVEAERKVSLHETIENRLLKKRLVLRKFDRHNGQALAGVRFRLWAIQQDGSTIVPNPAGQEEWVTDQDGRIETPELPYGNYRWEESQALPGYHQPQQDLHVSVAADSQIVFDWSNEPTQVCFRKVESESGRTLPGAKISLRSEEGEMLYVLPDGEHSWRLAHAEEKGAVPARWLSTQEAVTVRGLTVGQRYQLLEEEAPAGYAKAEALIFEVREGLGIQLVNLENRESEVEIEKQDARSNQRLAGAILALYDEQGQIVKDRKTGEPLRWLSRAEEGEAGVWRIRGLEVGKSYYLREEKAPPAYIKAKQDQHLQLRDTAQVQRFICLNEPEQPPVPPALPKTGFGQDHKLLTAIALLLAALSLLYCRHIYQLKKRRKKEAWLHAAERRRLLHDDGRQRDRLWPDKTKPRRL